MRLKIFPVWTLVVFLAAAPCFAQKSGPGAAGASKKKKISTDQITETTRKLAEQTVRTVSWPIRFMKNTLSLVVTPLDRGMYLNIPAVDTDPNRGLTYGIMPVIILNTKKGERIEQIYAPSLTYNRFFKWTAAHRVYWFPTRFSQVSNRVSYSGEANREAMIEYKDDMFMGRRNYLSGRLWFTRDGSRRFYGRGPNSQKGSQSNYIRDSLLYKFSLGLPLSEQWKINFGHGLSSDKILDGPVATIAPLSVNFPGLTTSRRAQIAHYRLFFNYDSRDAVTTTTEGEYLEVFAETSPKNLGSAFSYQTYGMDGRIFIPNNGSDKTVTAARLKIQQQTGDGIPFYALSDLGGKFSLRGYGEGRFVDKGLLTFEVEQRFRFQQLNLMNIKTDFEIDPFLEIGSIFPRMGTIHFRDLRPVAGVSIRAVARPQVVGSFDLGIGDEGAVVFMDVDYSF